MTKKKETFKRKTITVDKEQLEEVRKTLMVLRLYL